jgi:ligand-binding sensor domain-containing protein/signal transduction histidine kinase
MLSRLLFRIDTGIFVALILFFGISTHGQSYNFTNFNLEEGLPQSQVTAIFQAKDRTLWLGSYGGVSNFDGKEFNSLSKADGLISNSVMALIQDYKGQIIVGTNSGISVIRNGKVIKAISQYPILTLKKDKNGVIWGISSYKLFKLVNDKVIFVDIDGERITALSENANGDLFLVASGKAIYRHTLSKWLSVITLPKELEDDYVFKLVFDRLDQQKIYLLSAFKGVFVYDGSAFKSLFHVNGARYNTLIQDFKDNLWVGTQNGAYLIKKSGVIYFNAENGLADDPVLEIFNDAENNIWISSSTNGIFKYEGDSFIRLNKIKGKNLEYTISGISSDKNNNLFVGTFSHGLLRYDGNNVEEVKNPAFKDRNIYFLYRDREQNVWFSVHDSGIWKTDGKNYTLVYKVGKYNFHLLLKDQRGGAWICNPFECMYILDGKKQQLSGFTGNCSSLYELDKDRVLLGTTTGLYLIKDKKIDRSFEIKALKGACILNMVKQGDYLLIGTLGDGMISWNLKTQEIKKYTVADGLYSNDVYSLTTDNYQKLWIGTGRGINKLSFNKAKNKYEVFSKNSIIIECNQAAILNYRDNILIGTISGLIQCKTNVVQDQVQHPVIHLNKVSIYHKTDNTKDQSIFITDDTKRNYEFGYNQNHISINYKGVFLTNPKGVTYRYKLTGLDVNYGKAIKNTQVEYSALRPGTYTFYVYAIANGQQSNVSEFNFVIVPPFYETIWFSVLAIIMIIFLIWLIFYSFFKSQERKKLELEQIKHKEQNKIRKQTSEDFHDDIGNKLTRINVLSEILDKKLDKDQVEQKELIRLIKENAGLLYTGTKDILWALNPQSNNLFEMLVHINDFGIDLFQNTGIKFEMDGIMSGYQKIQLPMEFNRNFTLIFKEILNNVLKHAKSNEVLVMVVQTPQHTIDVITIDNGVGFDTKTVEKGSGLNNIQTRCKRIKAIFKLNSTLGKGTTSIISTKITVTN